MTDVRDMLIRIRAADTATRVVENLGKVIEGTRTNLDFAVNTSAIFAAQKIYEDINREISKPFNVSNAIDVDTSAAQNAISDLWREEETLMSSAQMGFSDFFDIAKNSASETADAMNTYIGDACYVMTDGIINFGEATESNVNAAQDAIEDLWREEETLLDITDDIETQSTSVFGAFQDAAGQVESSIGRIIASVTAMVTGASVAGISWENALDSNAYTDEVLKIIDANKKFGASSDAITKKAQEMADEGWTSKGKATRDLFKAFGSAGKGGKMLGRTEEERVEGAAAISKLIFTSETLEGQSVEGLLKKFGRQGKLRSTLQTEWTQSGFDIKDVGSAEKRIKAMIAKGKEASIELEFEEAPWKRAEVALGKLKKSIGESIAKPMSYVINLITDFIDLLNKIPGAPAFLAILAILTAVGGAISLLLLSLGPLVPALRTAYGAILKYAVANLTSAEYITIADAATNKYSLSLNTLKAGLMNAAKAAWAKVTALGTYIYTTITAGGVTGFFTRALNFASKGLRGLITGLYGAARAMVALMVSNPYLALGALIIGVILLAAKLGLLQKAWDKFAKSEFGKDVISFFKTVAAYVKIFAANLFALLSQLYSNKKSGIVATIMDIAGAIGAAYDKFDAFYSALKGGKTFDILFKGGEFLKALGPLAIPLGILVTVVTLVAAYISVLVKIFKSLWEFIQNPITTINKVLQWIHDLFSRLFNFLVKIIPGAERSVAESEAKKLEDKKGFVYHKAEGEEGEEGYKPAFWSKKGDASNTPVDPGKKIREARTKAEALPTAYDEIISGLRTQFDRLLNWLKTLPGLLANKITGAIFGNEEDIGDEKEKASDALKQAQEDLGKISTKFSDIFGHDFKWNPDQTGHGEGFVTKEGSDTPLDPDEIPGEVKSAIALRSKEYYRLRDLRDAAKKKLDELNANTPSTSPPNETPPPTNDPNKKVYQSISNPDRQFTQSEYDSLPEEEKNKLKRIPGAYLGGFITGAGLLYGHKGEPIIPAKIASSSVLIDKLSALSKGTRSSTSTTDSSNHYYTINFNHYGSGEIDLKTKKEFIKLIDSYMAKNIRHRQGH